MKRSILGAAVALSLLGGPASAAVTLNAEGLGQGLLFPFFTTQNGQTTLINVHNQSDRAKALKVRIMEGHAGQEALTFNAYVRPNGRWSAALAAPASGDEAPAVLSGNGSGCTVPQLAAAEPLRTYAYDGDNGPQSPARTHRGYVEVVELGEFSPELAVATFGDNPQGCESLVTRMRAGGAWDVAPNAELTAPGGRLRGDAVIIDTADGTSFDYPALAFDGLADAPRQRRLQGSDADLIGPRLSDIAAGPGGDIRVELFDQDGAPVSLRYAPEQGYQAISALLASSKVRGVYNIEPGVAGRSEWVISRPTRADQYRVISPDFPFPCSPTTSVRHPVWNVPPNFQEQWKETEACGVVSILQIYSDTSDLNFPEAPPEWRGFVSNRKPIMFSETGVGAEGDDRFWVNLGAATGSIELDFQREWVFPDGLQSAPDLDGKCWQGVPVWAWQVQTYDNANAQPDRISTFPEARVASRSFELVECYDFD